jgi:hypothetical protein
MDLRGGIYAFEPGEKLNHAEIAKAVKEAHLRGLIVYATVNCGVPAGEREKVLGTFRELLDLGAEGLWLSFDDKGPGGDPDALVKQALDLGRQRHISGHLIAITPPKGSYPKISTDFNRKVMKIPGMEAAIWFWTGLPSTEALAEARSIGLKARPGWWHNWPRRYTPQAYTGVPPMALGWSSPEYDVLAAGGDCLDAVMPWGGNEFGQDYVAPVIGWWGWNPQGHDWNVHDQLCRTASLAGVAGMIPFIMQNTDGSGAAGESKSRNCESRKWKSRMWTGRIILRCFGQGGQFGAGGKGGQMADGSWQMGGGREKVEGRSQFTGLRDYGTTRPRDYGLCDHG